MLRRLRIETLLCEESIDITDIHEPIDPIENAEPMDPTEAKEPMLPIDRTEPVEQIDRNESCDRGEPRRSPLSPRKDRAQPPAVAPTGTVRAEEGRPRR